MAHLARCRPDLLLDGGRQLPQRLCADGLTWPTSSELLTKSPISTFTSMSTSTSIAIPM